MKVNQSFIINTLTDKITMIEKDRFVKNLAGEVAKKRNKLIEVKEISIMNKMNYAELVEKYKDGLTKLSKGIYYIKIDKENILVCLVDNNLEDFNKLYSKIKENNKTISSSDIEEENNIIERGREIEVKREEVKRVISRAIIVGIAAVMSMSLFACKPKEKVEKIEIPLEQSVNSNETKAFDNEQAIKDAMAVYNVDSSIAEKTIWKKVHHAWPEPPEEQKIYTKKDEDNNNTSYVFPYYYKGKAYWIGTSNNSQTGNMRFIYKKISDNYRDSGPNDRVMVVGADKTEEVWQLLEILEAGDNIVKGVTKGSVRNGTKIGLDGEVTYSK